MELGEIKAHWQNWAKAGTGIAATTKTPTVKALEIDALSRAVSRFGLPPASSLRGLEVACGNGINAVSLLKRHPNLSIDGFDYIEDMVASARKVAAEAGVSDRSRFFVGDMRQIARMPELEPGYHLIFTDRAIINLNEWTMQRDALTSIAQRLLPGGLLLIIENFNAVYGQQNEARTWLGMERRSVAEFNLFLNDDVFMSHMQSLGLPLLGIDDFGSLHDIVLYLLVPALNGGVVDYDHPLVEKATELSLAAYAHGHGDFGQLGQNRLYAFRKP
jgi:SAM-dependent methyltransferase